MAVTSIAQGNYSAVNKHSGYDVTLLSIGHLLCDFYCNFLPILIPLLIVNMGLSLALSGILVMAMAITANVLQPIFGYYMDKYNFNRLLLIVLPFGAAFICLTSFTASFYTLLLCVAASGLAASVFHPMATGIVGKIANKKKMGLSLSFFISGGNLGFAFAPILLVYFIQYYSLKMLPLLVIPTLILSIFYYQSRLYKVSTVNKSENIRYKLNWHKLWQNIPLIKLNAAMAIRTWAHSAVTTFLPTLLVLQGYDKTTSGWLLTLFLIGAAVGGMFGGILNDHIGQKKVIGPSMLIAVFPAIYFFTAETVDAVSIFALIMTGFFIQAAHPCSVIWCQKFLPDNPNLASGLMLGLSFGLGGIGAALTAIAAEYIGLRAALLITVLMPLAGALLIYYIPEQPPWQLQPKQ
ncbi:MFS transporter [Pectinatus frisingensis]|uniref:MFS transporter n=1 Tax=Pectinatus frisingensis TaxID=865 RepID=UPI0018C555D0|nr:MFS transporter [Pectinatus frisingensis]